MRIIKIIFILTLIMILSGCTEKQYNIKIISEKNNTKTIIELAREDAIKRFNISENTIEVRSVIPVEWTDTSLGYPEPGKEIGRDYPLETIQGYVIIISANGKLYEYHSDYHRIIPPKGHIENIIPMIINNS